MADEIIDKIYNLIIDVANNLGKPIVREDLEIIDRGCPHIPCKLKENCTAVYMFQYKGEFLKIGRVGKKSNARFLSQHYNINSARSNLAKQIVDDPEMLEIGVNIDNVKEWIKANTRRIDIFIDNKYGRFAEEMIEGILHYAFNPRYEQGK